MNPVEPIFVTDIFAELHDELIALLRHLPEADWRKPTVAGDWRVSDVAAHLLDSDIRRLSYQRDRWPQVPPETPIESYRDLVGFLNQINADWIKAMKRVSPPTLVDFLAITGPQVAALFRSLDPFGPALFGVAWAGEEASPNWFDIAREYTEKWHHQQQIRDAVEAPGLTTRRWLFPVLATFLRGLPHTYRETEADDGTRVVFTITGEAGGQWVLSRENGGWKLYAGDCDAAVCNVCLDQDTAWRLLTKGLSRDEAVARVEFIGDERLGQPILGMLAVMA